MEIQNWAEVASAVNKELNKQLSSFKKQLLGLRVNRSYPLKVIQPHCESGIGRSSRFGAKKYVARDKNTFTIILKNLLKKSPAKKKK